MSQKDFEIILELKSLETLFTQLSDEKRKLYAEDLSGFDLEVIRAAVKVVRKKWDRVSFPPPGFIVAACADLKVQTHRHATRMATGEDFPWLQKGKQREELIKAFLNSFQRSVLMAEAIAGGYDHQLLEYARQVAGVQAQILIPHGHGAIAVSWHVVKVEGAIDEEWRQQRDFLQDMRRTLAYNENVINVPVPTKKIEQWIAEVERARFYKQTLGQEPAFRAYRQSETLAEALPPVVDPGAISNFELESAGAL